MNELKTYSARWGRSFRLVQGAGGNTSFKSDGLMTVKASGFRLADALSKEVFVTVDHALALRMADGGPAPAPVDGSTLRASIETSLHAVLPQAAVAHLHMQPLISIAVCEDAEARLGEAFEGMKWAFIPYLKPGVAVAQAARCAVSEHGAPDIIVLANHGVVFAGDDFGAIDALIREADRRLQVEPRPAGKIDLGLIAERGGQLGLEPVRLKDAHLMALDPLATSYACQGSLYPDHVVFLGRGAHVGTPVSDSLLHIEPGLGAFLPIGLPQEAHEMAACLSDVVRMIPEGARLRTLTREEEDELVNWDAEIYRRTLAQPAA